MTEIDEVQLNQVLATNPFLKELDRWALDLSSFAEGRKKMEELDFVLSSDKSNFSYYQNHVARQTPNWDSYLHPEVLPQPFIGNPRAPLWLLLLNPGYSFPDRYDHLGVCSGECIFDRGRNRDEVLGALKKRQSLLLDQLKLNQDAPFYILDNSFNTLPDDTNSRKKGGFRWWRTILFGANQPKGFLLPECGVSCDAISVGSKLFVLECCPYHSTNFNAQVLWESGNEYMTFWKSLISWAVKAGKKFIVRSERVRTLLKGNKLNVDESNSVGFKNCRNAALTISNMKGRQKVVDEIRQMLATAN